MILKLIQGTCTHTHQLMKLWYATFPVCTLNDDVFCIVFRGPTMKTIAPANVVLFEGILVLYDPIILQLMHMKLFVDTDSDTRLARRGK